MRTLEADKGRKTRGLLLVAVLALASLGTACARPILDAEGAGGYGPLSDPVADEWDDRGEWGDDPWWGEGTEWDTDDAADRDEDAGWHDDADSDDADGLDDGADGEDGAGDAEPIASFAIDGDRIDLGDATPEAAASAAAIWKRFAQLVPADQRTMLVGFELLPESYGGAHVYPTDHDPSQWIMGIGLGLGDELDATLIHEFGHLLTLQAKEVPPGSDDRGCTTYFTGEGCALSGSTFAAYVERFWPPSLIDEAAELERSGDGGAIDTFFERHPDDFVTDYAATNPAEDLAETVTAFVMGDQPDGATIADQKIAFLWDEPDMVALRTRIRTAL